MNTIYQGWLKKKGKKRWFILMANSLYWFAKEQKATITCPPSPP